VEAEDAGVAGSWGISTSGSSVGSSGVAASVVEGFSSAGLAGSTGLTSLAGSGLAGVLGCCVQGALGDGPAGLVAAPDCAGVSDAVG